MLLDSSSMVEVDVNELQQVQQPLEVVEDEDEDVEEEEEGEDEEEEEDTEESDDDLEVDGIDSDDDVNLEDMPRRVVSSRGRGHSQQLSMNETDNPTTDCTSLSDDSTNS
ncbi:histone chaperone ASF1-like [Manihot esculenta]|uniref:histone chaperone ASF1-like n=1 Tax=Manihot esculenta TaxID=3983 RepID=UPI001CC46F41|nr:histone chaperone ASF1-like [Manihot esculenta]